MPSCPRCDKPLTPKNSGSVQLDHCPSCDGIWLEREEFRTAKDERDPDLGCEVAWGN